MGMQPIPWSSIIAYANYYDFNEDQTDDLNYFIRRMDSFYMKKIADKK